MTAFKKVFNRNEINKYDFKNLDGQIYEGEAAEKINDFYSNIIFLTDVYATIILKNSNLLTISSSYGKYNSNNLDTIFSKNVIINYLDNKITGEVFYENISIEEGAVVEAQVGKRKK